ncbi:MAG: biotin--[acetyl-CoA-carboxylase] ligase [Bacillota bacterium]|nr:biotin--[acetyl-CoA-carboxylase] ligase [Bacillota bacterium]
MEGLRFRLFELERVGSTSDLLRAMAARGAPEGTVVVAAEQDEGRGRLGRRWSSPRGGLWLSLLLRPAAALAPERLSSLAPALGLAVVEAVEPWSGGRPLGLKWPNDVVAGEPAPGGEGEADGAPRRSRDGSAWKKVAGLLCEAVPGGEAGRAGAAVIAGIGVNADLEPEALPAELRGQATTLRRLSGGPVPLAELRRRLLEAVDRTWSLWQASGFAALRQEWLARAIWLGERVQLQGAPLRPGDAEQRVVSGTFLGVDEEAALLLQLPGGRVERFLAGELSLRRERAQA